MHNLPKAESLSFLITKMRARVALHKCFLNAWVNEGTEWWSSKLHTTLSLSPPAECYCWSPVISDTAKSSNQLFWSLFLLLSWEEHVLNLLMNQPMCGEVKSPIKVTEQQYYLHCWCPRAPSTTMWPHGNKATLVAKLTAPQMPGIVTILYYLS